MASTRKKSKTKKRKPASANSASKQLGFLFSGINSALSLIGAGLIFLFNGLKSVVVTSLDAIYGNRGRHP
ncbi:MAG: hypothetical protein QGF46_05370, partial [Planctomycetota bacterium]|nr:hypothetical protein [Planctomycetota bacterium]